MNNKFVESYRLLVDSPCFEKLSIDRVKDFSTALQHLYINWQPQLDECVERNAMGLQVLKNSYLHVCWCYMSQKFHEVKLSNWIHQQWMLAHLLQKFMFRLLVKNAPVRLMMALRRGVLMPSTFLSFDFWVLLLHFFVKNENQIHRWKKWSKFK